MNKLRNLLILVSAILCMSVSVSNAEQNKIILEQGDLQEFFVDILSDNTPDHVEEINVTNFTCKPASIALPTGKLSYRSIKKTSSLSPGKKFITAVILVNNQEQATVKMYGDVHFWGSVISLAHPLPRRSILSEDDLVTEFTDISMLGDDIIYDADDIIGKQTKKSLPEGAVLYRRYLKNPTLVKRGDLVTILATVGSLRVTVPGEIKNTGGLGDTVRVKNMMSRRTLQARVIDEGLVEVEL